MKPTEELRNEHDGILLMLQILEEAGKVAGVGKGVELGQLGQIIEFFRVFVDRCHHGKEEEIFFPALERAGIPRQGGPIGVMLHEHQLGRGHVTRMGEALAKLQLGTELAYADLVKESTQYLELLRQHIRKENEVLFPMADKVLSQQEQENLTERFERLEIEKIGKGRHEAFHRLITELQALYL